MLNAGHRQQETLQIKQEEKPISRHLSKEITKVESSFRVLYYGKSSVSIPFMWESQPGTPKHKFSDTSLPPLTPPPSYQFSPKSNFIRKNSKPRFIHTILKMGSKKSHVSPSFSSSSSSGSSTYSATSVIDRRRRSSPVRSRSGAQYEVDEEQEQEQEQGQGQGKGNNNGGASPNSTLCFGRDGGSSRVKKALWAIIGYGRG